ncbi:MAG TPA: DUF115 domain-containing protein [Deltaproteobacteria bacterium]|nr:DUF115 domain-containing protein [Deltaproteobacteria bacterium]
MSGEVLKRNLEILRGRWGAGAAAVLEDGGGGGGGDGRRLTVERARSGALTLRWDGLYLHSRYDPVLEARRFAERLEPAAVAFLFGWGADYFIEAVIQRLAGAKRLYIFPTNVILFRQTLELFDYSAIFGDERVELILGGAAALARALKEEAPFSPLVIRHPPSLKAASAELAPLRDLLEEGLYSDFLTRRWQEMDGEMRRLVAGNWRRYSTLEGVAALFGTEQGGRAFVLGAGPSLSTDIEGLRAGWDEAVTIVVDAACGAVVAAGLEPDFVVAVDPHPDIAELLGAGESKGTLVFAPTVVSEAVDRWKGPKVLAFLSTMKGLEAAMEEKGVLFSGGSVIHPAVDLAVRLGCAEVVLAGCDFAFTDGFSHVEGMPFRERMENGSLQRRIKGAGGEMLATSKNLIAYLRELERYIAAHGGVSWTNFTARGAVIAGAARAPLPQSGG